nr:twin-arginine translocation signal domain-containing protein [Nitrososphaeria archaeon]
MTVYNRPQYHAREAAIALGEQRFDDTRKHIHALKNMLDQGDAVFTEMALKLTKPEGFAGGGKIRKVTRRDVLKGLGAGAAGALGAGKAGTKKGIEEVAEAAAPVAK